MTNTHQMSKNDYAKRYRALREFYGENVRILNVARKYAQITDGEWETFEVKFSEDGTRVIGDIAAGIET